MNTSVFVGSLKYLKTFENPISLASWIYEELSLINYSDQKLEISLKLFDFEVFESVIKHLKDKDLLNKLLLDSIEVQKIKILMKHGADIHINNDQLLVGACYYGYEDVAELCLKNEANIHTREDLPL